MIRSLVRHPVSYFRSYRNYFVTIYIAFLAFPGADLVLILSSQDTWMRLATLWYVTAGVTVATIWGYVVTKLYVYPEPFSLRRIFANPYKPIFLSYMIYLIPVILAIGVEWGDPSEIYTSPSIQVTYVLEGSMLQSAVLGPVLLSLGASVAISFVAYPIAVLTRLRSQIKDKEVRGALKVIASSFGAVALVLFLSIALSYVGYSIHGAANFLSVSLLILAVRSFRRPTFLKAFLGVVPSLESLPIVSHVDQTVLIYPHGDGKFGPISKYLLEGVNQNNRVIFFHQEDEALVREGLSRQGVDVRHYMMKGVLRLSPLGSIYQTRGVLDDTPLELCQELTSEAKMLGKEGLRVIIDYEDFIVRPTQKFVEHLIDPRWTSPDHYVHILMAFDSTAVQGEDSLFAQLRPNIRVLDMSESLDVFSKTIGLSHTEIAGRKILVEYDPQSDYERVLKSLLTEAAYNFERMVVFTRKDSPIYPLVQQQPGSKIFILTSRVSYPKVESENKVLLPAYDTSLLLDSLNKTIEAYLGGSFTIMFDSISHHIFTIGQDRSYSLVRQSLELMVSNRITAIFLLNSSAHDSKTVSTFENMFDIELICATGARVPEIRRKLSATL
jgi:hypothetical protein